MDTVIFPEGSVFSCHDGLLDRIWDLVISQWIPVELWAEDADGCTGPVEDL